ncbi:FG-GAP-like repeat-containing protein [Tunturiibacter gelidoferens]|uniref:FG-GAP-like repeat-containing protein n=1 Tax=Tunturiibacter gelidiferens TaxID=3069689 RepID=A0AAU7Z0G4_9BACT
MPIRSVLPKTIALCSLSLVALAATAQQFQQPLVIATGSWPVGIVAADLNGDGRVDLIYTDYGATATASTTHILLSNEDGTFAPGQTLATAGASIAVADFNHDGHVDLAWVWGAVGLGKAYLALGRGDGTFAPAQELGTFAIVGTKAPQFLYVMGAQLHDTGPLDLLVEDAANPALITLTMDESGTLVRIVGTRLANGVGPMATADLNGDGHTDLVIQSVAGGAADVFLGLTDGLLTAAGTYAGSSAAQSMLLHDVDGDGHPDLVLEGVGGRIEIFHGNADGSFSTTSEGGSGSADATTGLGGHLVAVSNVAGRNNFYTATPAGMSVLLGQSDLSLTLQGIYNAGPGRTSFAVADFNGDGLMDVAVDSPEGIAILLGSADGRLGSSRAFAAGQPALSGALGQFSGSGNLDAIVNVSASQALLLHGNGDGTFSTTATPTTAQVGAAANAQITGLPREPQMAGLVQAAAVTVDLDGDGNQDVIVAYDNQSADHAHPTASIANAIYIWYGNADGSFSSPVLMAPSRNFFQLTVVDVNGDGRPDLVMSDGYVVNVQNNLGGRMFGEEAHFLAGMGINSISAGDVNNDGLTDLVVANGGTVIMNPAIGRTTPENDGVITGGITVLLSGIQTKIVSGRLTAAPNATDYGETFTLVAQVTPPANGPSVTGTVTFAVDGKAVGSVPVSGGVASISVPGTVPIGWHALTAEYNGSSTYNSVVLNGSHAVMGIPTTVVFTISTPSTIYFGQTVSGSAVVTASDGSTPTGTISFFDGTTNICTIPVTQAANCPASAGSGFAVGIHTLTAVYSGDATHQGSTSAPVTVTVLPLAATMSAFSISVTGSTTTVVGGMVNLQVAVAPQAGYLQPVQLSCSDLPSEATCRFATGTIPGGGGTTTLQLRMMAPRSCQVADSESRTAGLPFASTTLAALVVLLLPGKRRRTIRSLLIAVLAICGTASLTGCGACTNLGTKPGSYMIRVIGTGSGTFASIVSTKVKVTVQD